MSKYFQWRGALLDDYGVSRTAFWLVCIPSVLGILTVLPDRISIIGGVGLWASASIVSTGFLGIVLAVSALIRSRIRVSRAAAPFAVLLTMLLAGAARGAGVALTFGVADVDDRTTVMGRVIGSSLIFTIWLLLIGGFLSALAGYRAARKALLDEIVMRELQMRLFDEPRTLGLREDAVARLTETNAIVREILASADEGSAEEYARISLLLNRAIDERIRPLVHEMWFEPPPELTAPPSVSQFLRKAYLTQVPRLWALSLYAFIQFSSSIVTVGFRLGVEGALIECCAVAVILLGERTIRPVPSMLSRSITVALLLIAPLGFAWIALADQTRGMIPFFGLLALAVTAPILTLTCCAAKAVLDDRGPSLQELQARLDRDDWAEQLATLERRAAENSVASVIHNTVQARLLAAALQLETAAMTNDDARAAMALEDARSALDSATTNQPTAPRNVEDRLASIARAWQGIIEVEIIDSDVVFMSASAKLALDAIEECVANAARHASATQIEVSLRKGERSLEVIVRDNGHPFEPHAGAGMGTDWMQRVTRGRLERSRTPEGWNQVRLFLA